MSANNGVNIYGICKNVNQMPQSLRLLITARGKKFSRSDGKTAGYGRYPFESLTIFTRADILFIDITNERTIMSDEESDSTGDSHNRMTGY